MAKKMSKTESDAWQERVLANANRLRELAEKAQAELDKRKADRRQ
jgi:hypothetical protein